MINWISLSAAAILAVVLIVIALRIHKKTVTEMRQDAMDLTAKLKELNEKVFAQEQENELLRELIFFLNLGKSPSSEEKREMMEQILDGMERITNMRSKNSSFRTAHALEKAGELHKTGEELRKIFDRFYGLLANSVVDGKSLCPQIDNYINYCGLHFCNRVVDNKFEVEEIGEVVNFGHVEE